MADAWSLCAAPMMGYTDRHFRVLLRLLAPTARLYTEMLTTGALLNRGSALLTFEDSAQRTALQLGGSDPAALATCARAGERAGYAEINLNIGCPSPRVSRGRFGACLMAEPELVRDCISAMRDAVSIPVTVKCRLGIDVLDEQLLEQFVARVAPQVDALIVHARVAVLDGLTPEQNREVPPLRHDWVFALARRLAPLPVVLNGGLRNEADVALVSPQVAGVMLGRAITSDPTLIGRLQDNADAPASADVLRAYAAYVRRQQQQGVPFAPMARRALALFTGVPGARAYRRTLTRICHGGQGSADDLLAAVDCLQAAQHLAA